MAEKYDGWEPLGEPLGEGGQGKVYKARRPERVKQRKNANDRVRGLLLQINGGRFDVDELIKGVMNLGGEDDPKDLGALKIFTIPNADPDQADQAVARLNAEIEALRVITHPAVLKLLHAPRQSSEDRYIVTEFHPKGTLEDHLEQFKGKPLEALQAFKPLVQGVEAIHRRNVIHRDIKPGNIFVAMDGRLVLGDFGIVFFTDAQRTRLTNLFGEIVGTHFWMAPWAYQYSRVPIDSVNSSFDLFPLAKILWSMVSGRNGFAFWEYDRSENNLECLFPDDLAMPIVNEILARCVVREEKDCMKSALELLALVDSAIERIARHAERPDDKSQRWRCRMCGRGHYVKLDRWFIERLQDATGSQDSVARIAPYICDNGGCQHVELFRE